MSAENTLIEDELDIKMDPEDIPNTTDTDQVPDEKETEQDLEKMDIEQAPGEIETVNVLDRIETEQIPEDETPFDNLIEDLTSLQNVDDSTPILVTDETDEDITTENEISLYGKYTKRQYEKKLAKDKDSMERQKIVLNVLRSCQDIAKRGTNKEVPVPPIQRLHFFTKANPDYLAQVLQDYKSRNRSVKQAVIDTKPIPSNMNPIIYDHIRDVFVEFYLEKKQIPTKKDLLDSLQEKGSNMSKEYYRSIKLRTLVKNNLVIYHHIPKLNRYILIENPELPYLRNKYLRQVTKYRESGTNFIYVTIMTVDTDVGAMTLTLAASSTAGLIVQLKPVLPTAEGFSLTIKHWLSQLLPSLNPTAVIILTQPRKKDTTPTPHSTKDYMTAWLNNKDIPTELGTNKGQLYELVKLSKNNKDTGFYDEVFTCAGFKVIVNPIEYKNLNYFNAIYRECASANAGECDEAERMAEFMKKMSQEDWMKLEELLIEEEKQMIKEDREMETIIDNIFEMVKNGDVDESDFPEGCEGYKSDNFDVHVGDIIID